jgi:uncharacterized protein (DUF433 family)
MLNDAAEVYRMSLTLQEFRHPIHVDATGVARVGDTRVTLETVIRRFLLGDTPEEIADAYLLELSDAYASISYYLQHRAEVDGYMREVDADEARVAQVIRERSNPAALRAKLLERQSARHRAG